MDAIVAFFQDLTDVDRLAVWVALYGGLYLVILIVFAETGLFMGFFLPGDSLLFVAGLIIANASTPTDNDTLNLVYWITLISLAGIIGNRLGYYFGQRAGPGLFKRKDGRLFKRHYLLQAKEFYEQHGGRAIVLARFFPIIRTFAPIVAGVVRMDLRRFMVYNIAGSILWVGGLVLVGFFLGANVWVKENFDKIILAIGAFTLVPVLWKMIVSKTGSPTLVIGREVVEEEFGFNDPKS